MIGDFVIIGEGTKIWHPEQVNIYGRSDCPCIIGDRVNIGSFVEIGPGVKIGNNVSIGAHCFIPEGVTIEDDCFIGPRVTFTNDKYPPSSKTEWERTIIKRGARIGAGAVILPGVEIGIKSLIGAGSVVTKNVPPYMLVKGNPAKAIITTNTIWDLWDSIGLPNRKGE